MILVPGPQVRTGICGRIGMLLNRSEFDLEMKDFHELESRREAFAQRHEPLSQRSAGSLSSEGALRSDPLADVDRFTP